MKLSPASEARLQHLFGAPGALDTPEADLWRAVLWAFERCEQRSPDSGACSDACSPLSLCSGPSGPGSPAGVCGDLVAVLADSDASLELSSSAGGLRARSPARSRDAAADAVAAAAEPMALACSASPMDPYGTSSESVGLCLAVLLDKRRTRRWPLTVVFSTAGPDQPVPTAALPPRSSGSARDAQAAPQTLFHVVSLVLPECDLPRPPRAAVVLSAQSSSRARIAFPVWRLPSDESEAAVKVSVTTSCEAAGEARDGEDEHAVLALARVVLAAGCQAVFLVDGAAAEDFKQRVADRLDAHARRHRAGAVIEPAGAFDTAAMTEQDTRRALALCVVEGMRAVWSAELGPDAEQLLLEGRACGPDRRAREDAEQRVRLCAEMAGAEAAVGAPSAAWDALRCPRALGFARDSHIAASEALEDCAEVSGWRYGATDCGELVARGEAEAVVLGPLVRQAGDAGPPAERESPEFATTADAFAWLMSIVSSRVQSP
eukprot:m51a1_g3630 hypothetical protein (490) ;mRNA; f:132779-135062